MYFKKIYMHGFKSFADPVTIEFHILRYAKGPLVISSGFAYYGVNIEAL